ncbi:MAG: hypothetical protein RLZZ214_3598 [Verrucomicrobiota bacterium]|jgi:hypothetical protein
MKKNLRFLSGVAAGLFAAIGFSSCAYDPYYGSTTVGGSYTSGYGGDYYGNGYGGGGASTSVFIATGNPRWGYDPSCYSYYDYTRRSYYDPYLNGYYPVGYRPPVVYGVSHPYGWSPGSRYCRPPGHVSNVTITNYRNRESIYRERGYVQSSYGRQRQQESGPGRAYDQRPSSGGYGNSSYQSRPSSNYRPSATPNSREQQGRPTSAQPGAKPASRYPSQYNSPVAASQSRYSPQTRSSQNDPRSRQAAQPAQRQVRPLAPPDQSRGIRQAAQLQQSQGRPRETRGKTDKDETRNDGTDARGRIRN